MRNTPIPITKPRARRPWWLRVFRAGLWALLVLAIFHRPIVHYGGRWAAIYFAKKENIALDLKIDGNLWSGLEISGIRATRIAPASAPIETLTLDRVAVGYDLWKLIRGDLSGLQRVEVGTLDAELRADSTPKKRPEKQPAPLADSLRALLSKPLPTPTVSIKRVDLRGLVVVENFRMSLSPHTAGILAWDAIGVPGQPPIPGFQAATQFSAGRLVVSAPSAPILLAAAKDGALTAELNILGSRLSVRVAPAPKGGRLHGDVKIEKLDAQALGKQFGATLPIALTVPDVVVSFDGVPEEPSTWIGAVNASVSTPGAANIPAGQLEMRMSVKDLVLKVDALNVDSAGVTFRGKGEVPLGGLISQNGTRGLPETGTFGFDIAADDLSVPSAFLPVPITGKLAGHGGLLIEGGEVKFGLTATGDGIAAQSLKVTRNTLQIDARIPARLDAKLKDLVVTSELTINDINAGAARVEKVRVTSEFRDLRAAVKELRIERGTGIITAIGNAVLDENGALAGTPEGRFTVHIPSIADFGIAANGVPLSGSLEGEGSFTLGQPVDASKGRLSLHGKNLMIGTAAAGTIDIEAGIADGEIVANKCVVELPGKASIVAGGRFGLKLPNAFTGKLAVKIPDLSALQPILGAFGEKRAIAGSVDLAVDGKGESGKPEAVIKLGAKGVKFGTVKVNEARVNAVVRNDSAEISELFFTNETIRAAARAAWKDGQIAVSDIDVRLDGQNVLAGSLSAPFQPQGPQPVPFDQPMKVSLVARELDMAKLLASLGKPASAAGKLSATVDVSGTIEQPKALVTAKGDGLRVTGMDTIPQTAFDTRATFEGSELKVTGTIRQPLVQPVTFSANTTVAVSSLLSGKFPPMSEIPLKAELNMPASQLDFLPRLVPAIRKVNGTANVSVRVGGTVAKPAIEGNVGLEIQAARFADPAIPTLTDFKARIDSTGERITFTQFSGDAGGGRFGLTGGINIADIAQPVFDLVFKSKDVLLVRDDSVLVRAETDVAIRGPLNTANVSGTVYIVQSRLNKEIEILPLALPGKPQPVPAIAAQPKVISFPQPPLRDWTFNVAVKTRAEDPFLVRSNLARGKVSLDVKLAGTGKNPYLVGAVTIDQFSATLPLSTLTTRRGLVTFSEDSPFEPHVEIEAESKIRQYTVIIRVDGPASKPRLDLESEPPLPQQEILSLLSTGSLSGEIGANNTAMATRAAVLVVKGWYKKIFKKDFPLGGNDGGDSLMDRFEVDFGAVDPKTGRNETTAQLRVTERLYFIGDLELGGGFSGRVKYLFRFR